jgi:NAD(P)-dependent dehydrogenase (short-subunit alcohol dehydrogenase family)
VPDLILDNPPCAYKLTEAQFNGPRTDGPGGIGTTVAQRLAAHGWKVVKVADGYVVPMTQPERGLVPLLLDAQAVEELVGAERLFPAPDPGTGPLVISSGVTCLAGRSVRGSVTVLPGATLIATGTTFDGQIRATGAAGVFLTGSTVHGAVSISGTTGAAAIADTTVDGAVRLSDNRTTGGAFLVAGNAVAGSLRCAGNTPDPVNIEIVNVVRGPKTGQCARL